MSRGRKKIKREICLDPGELLCECVWPLKLPRSQLEQLDKVPLYPDELQALAYKDLDQFTMQQAADKMKISKTVFAGIYSSARRKQTDCLINGKILTVMCDHS